MGICNFARLEKTNRSSEHFADASEKRARCWRFHLATRLLAYMRSWGMISVMNECFFSVSVLAHRKSHLGVAWDREAPSHNGWRCSLTFRTETDPNDGKYTQRLLRTKTFKRKKPNFQLRLWCWCIVMADDEGDRQTVKPQIQSQSTAKKEDARRTVCNQSKRNSKHVPSRFHLLFRTG